jgi:hypothetical protein
MTPEYFSFTRKRKFLRGFDAFHLSACCPLPKPLLLEILQALTTECIKIFSAEHLLNMKGRDRGQYVEIPQREAISIAAPEGEILFFAGTIRLKAEEDLDAEELVQEEKKDAIPEMLEHRLHFSLRANFENFPTPESIQFHVERHSSPLAIADLSLSEILSHPEVEISEFRLGLQEFQLLRSFFGPSPTVTDQLMIDAKDGELRLVLDSERISPKTAFPIAHSGIGEAVFKILGTWYEFPSLEA